MLRTPPVGGRSPAAPASRMRRAVLGAPPVARRQGWARDVNGRDRDETETRRVQVSRRDRDVEMHVVFNAVQVNVGLTTVATVTACPLVLGCIPDFCVAYLIAMLRTDSFYATTAC